VRRDAPARTAAAGARRVKVAAVDDHAGEVDSQPVRPPAQQILDTFARARALTISNALAVPGSTVRVSGRAVPGPGGPLRAPLSGVECVWYRSVVYRHLHSTWQSTSPPLAPFPDVAPSDLPHHAPHRATGLAGPPIADDRSSTAAFALDDATGVLVVDPTTSDIDTDVFAINAVVHVDDPTREPNALGFGGGPFDNQELHTEWVIPVGAPLLAVGSVGSVGGSTGTPALVPHAQDIVLVSTKPEQQILSRNRATVDPAAAHLPFRGGRSVGLLIGAVLAVAVVVVLVVLFVARH
jgi:E3 Ubiquitin ligase